MKVVTLKDVAFFLNGDRGKNYPSGSDFKENGIPFINAGDLSDDRTLKRNSFKYISPEHFKKLGGAKILKNDILYCLRGSLGKFAMHTENYNGSIASSLVVLRSKQNVLSKYLFYYLGSDIPQRLAIKNDNGTAQPNLSAKNLKTFEILLPSIEGQKKIVDILDNAAALRDKAKQLLTEYDALAQSIFLDMFGDPLGNPKKWKVKNLKELSTKIGSGNTPKGGSKVYVDEGITFFRSQNVWKNNLVMDDIAFIDQKTHDGMKKSSLKHGDILMTKTGRINTENSSLGRAAMYLGEDDKANLNGHVYLIRLKKEVLNEYILFILTTNQYREHIRRVCVGGIDKRQLNKNHLEEFPIIYPPMELQKEFAEKLKLIEQQKELAKQELKESEDLFNCLLQKAFKGELV
ncbi:MAG: restriction endonuclease subunit S [Ignavibacteriae bacterium]|nr:restriction endonuclease subunit S [Ignavibacteriota bacterium]